MLRVCCLIEPVNETEKKRSELIKFSEDSDLDQSVKYIKKASAKVINK